MFFSSGEVQIDLDILQPHQKDLNNFLESQKQTSSLSYCISLKFHQDSSDFSMYAVIYFTFFPLDIEVSVFRAPVIWSIIFLYHLSVQRKERKKRQWEQKSVRANAPVQT